MHRVRRLLAAGLTAGAAAAAVVPASADAARNPYTPQEVCGSSYEVKRSQSTPYGQSTIYLLRKPGTRRFCATTIKNKAIGRPTPMLLWIDFPLEANDIKDRGDFSYYSGPIRFTFRKQECPSVLGYFGGGFSSINRFGGCS